jgi:hypothetical protein
MMNRAPLFSFVAAAALSFFTTGCGSGLIAFTHELRVENNLSAEEIKNLQFYGSHKLLVVSGKTIEEVVIEEATPGIAVAVGSSAISISFEQGSSMDFSARDGRLAGDPVPSGGGFAQPPDPFPGNNPDQPQDPFTPAPVESGSFTGNYFLAVEPGGRVTFQTKPFEAVEDSFKAHLMIDSDTLEDVVKNRKVLPGLRLK